MASNGRFNPVNIFGSREDTVLAVGVGVLAPVLVTGVVGRVYSDSPLRVVAQLVVFFGLLGVYSGLSLTLWGRRQAAAVDAGELDSRFVERAERSRDRGMRLLGAGAFAVGVVLALPLLIAVV